MVECIRRFLLCRIVTFQRPYTFRFDNINEFRPPQSLDIYVMIENLELLPVWGRYSYFASSPNVLPFREICHPDSFFVVQKVELGGRDKVKTN